MIGCTCRQVARKPRGRRSGSRAVLIHSAPTSFSAFKKDSENITHAGRRVNAPRPLSAAVLCAKERERERWFECKYRKAQTEPCSACSSKPNRPREALSACWHGRSGCPMFLPGLSACAYVGQDDEHAAYRPPPSSESRLERRHGLAYACRPRPCPAGQPSLLLCFRRRRRCRRGVAGGGGARAGSGGLTCLQQCGAKPARTALVSFPTPAVVAEAS